MDQPSPRGPSLVVRVFFDEIVKRSTRAVLRRRGLGLVIECEAIVSALAVSVGTEDF